MAERGSAIAQFYLGLSYERGKGVSESEAEAVKWFRTAAEQGLAAAQAALGTRYFIGWGVQQSYREAMEWSLKAAKQGNPSAQAILGMICESGYGVPKNFILAYMWFTVSAHDPDFEPGTRRNLNEVARHLAPGVDRRGEEPGAALSAERRRVRRQHSGRCLFHIEAHKYGQRGRFHWATIVRFG
jgi:hypothetical protein